MFQKSGGSAALLIFLEKITTFAGLVQSGWNEIFHWFDQPCILYRSLVSIEGEPLASFTILTKELSLAKRLTSEFIPSCKSLIRMRKKRGINTYPSDIRDFIDCQLENRLLRTTL